MLTHTLCSLPFLLGWTLDLFIRRLYFQNIYKTCMGSSHGTIRPPREEEMTWYAMYCNGNNFDKCWDFRS